MDIAPANNFLSKKEVLGIERKVQYMCNTNTDVSFAVSLL